jgi:shikimate kinase
MGAGKSTLGPLLAEALRWEFLDVDAELVRRTGVTVAEFFQRQGEAAFRREEARLAAELSARDRLVLAPGGGWITGETALASLPAGSALVWLRVSPEEAVRRALSSGDVRPLLQGGDPLAAARRLLAAREAAYAQAHFTIDVDGRTPADLTIDMAEWLKTSSW